MNINIHLAIYTFLPSGRQFFAYPINLNSTHRDGMKFFVKHQQGQKSHLRQLVQIVSGLPENVYCWRLGREEGIESKRPFAFKVDGLNLAKYLTQGISNTI